ncbi:hypothetical protein LIA77_05355 [Sarocladium implicatum]|jgi:hypothetical protein|nr:hypothetical protein LIA77_05355 [Sarocladium implicatum]
MRTLLIITTGDILCTVPPIWLLQTPSVCPCSLPAPFHTIFREAPNPLHLCCFPIRTAKHSLRRSSCRFLPRLTRTLTSPAFRPWRCRPLLGRVGLECRLTSQPQPLKCVVLATFVISQTLLFASLSRNSRAQAAIAT